MRGAPYGRSPPSSRPLPAGLARLVSALPAPFLRSSKGFLHPALPAGLGGRRWEAPCPCPARGPLMGDPSQSPESPHNPQCPLTTVPSQSPESPHSPWCPLTTPRVPSQRSPHSPQCPLTTLPSQPLLSPHPPSPLFLPQYPNNLLSSTPTSPSCPFPSKQLALRLSTSPLAFQEAFLPRDVTAAGGRWQISTKAEPGWCLISGLGTASSCCPGCCWCVFMCHKQPRA